MQYDWRDDAQCRDLTSVNFFPDPQDKQAVDKATNVCKGCPVRQQCKAFAEAMPNTVGVFGGEFFELKEEDETGTTETG